MNKTDITYPNRNHEFIQVNLATTILVKVLEEHLDLLGYKIDAHLPEALVKLRGLNESIVVPVDDLEHLCNASDGQSSSSGKHALYLAEKLGAVVGEFLGCGHWLGC